MRPAALVAAIRQVVRELRENPLLDATERVGALMAQATTAGRDANAAERVELLAAFAELGAAASGSLDHIVGELRRTGAAKTAMWAYGGIRPYTTAQHLRTRV